LPSLVFLVDFDNTLLDNDAVKLDIEAAMRDVLGERIAARFWELYEAVRTELDVVDFHEDLRRLRQEFPAERARIDAASAAIAAWDFRSRLFPAALDALAHLKRLGTVFIVSDGDPLFQVTKIWRSGVTAAVDGRVLVFTHKERYLEAFTEQFPADHYVMVDDKPGVLMRSKAVLGGRLTTVFVRQGKYARDPRFAVDYEPDITLGGIGDVLRLDGEQLMAAAKQADARRDDGIARALGAQAPAAGGAGAY